MSTAKSSSKASGVKADTAESGTGTAEKTANPAGKTAPGKKGDLMYLGPTIAGIVKHSTVFKNGLLPKRAQECMEELPIMKKLFVEADKLPEAVKELKKQQSALSTAYAQTVQKFRR